VRFARLRDHAAERNDFFTDRLPLNLGDLHLCDRLVFVFAFSAEPLDEQNQSDEGDEPDCAKDNSFFHFAFNAAFEGK